MKNILMALLALLFGLSGGAMSNYSGYCDSAYTNLREGTTSVYGDDEMIIGNNSSGTAYYALIPFPDDRPTNVFVQSAVLRIAQTDESDSTALTMKIAPVTGSWTTSTAFASLPAYDSTNIASITLDSSNEPDSGNYDGRRTRYRYSKYYIPTGDFIESVYYLTYQGSSFSSGLFNYVYSATVYDQYWVWQEIDITTVMQNANSATGLLLYFDLPGTNSTRKYFKSSDNTDADYQILLTMTYGNAITIAPDAGAIDKQVISLKIAPDAGAIDKNVLSVKVYTTAWKTVF